MSLEPKKSRVALFFVVGFGLSLSMALLKALLAWATHTYLYSIPWVGGFLRSIELTEISNLLIFAILGVGIGGATFLLPRRWDHRLKLAFLFVVSPFVFSASYMTQQHLWIKAVAEQSGIDYREARILTNDYLERKTGNRGFFGFYPFSTQLAELPVRSQTLQSTQSLNPNEVLSQELASYDDPRADLAAYWFERVGWLIRFMYMTIAALTGLIYYFKGYAWAENRLHANTAAQPQPVIQNKRQSAPPHSKKTDNGQTKSRLSSNKPQTKPQTSAAYRDLYTNDPLTKPNTQPSTQTDGTQTNGTQTNGLSPTSHSNNPVNNFSNPKSKGHHSIQANLDTTEKSSSQSQSGSQPDPEKSS